MTGKYKIIQIVKNLKFLDLLIVKIVILQNDQALQKVKWLRVVLDEGHAIRNPNAQQTKAIYSLQAERKWVLTGKTALDR